MRLIAHLVVRDEADRYLWDCLQWLTGFADTVTVFDDRSDDGTADIARRWGCHVDIRPPDAASFMENESAFREAGWHAMEAAAKPVNDDWIIALDADEFLVAIGDERETVLNNIDRADIEGLDGLVLPVAEIFGWDSLRLLPLQRTDAAWGTITACRMVRWRPDGTFKNRRQGGGSVPTYVHSRGMTDSLHLAHVGYMDVEDRAAKHAHYSATRGHSQAHVQSILMPGRLQPWTGKIPWERPRG